MAKLKLTELQENETDVKIKDFTERLNLEILCRGKKRAMHIATFNINRPGLQLAGYYEHFSAERVQVIGEQEMSYLRHMTAEERMVACDNLCKFDFPCLVLTTVLEPVPELMTAAEKYGRNVFRSSLRTTAFMNEISIYLNELLAPTETVHGVLVDLFGVGVLIVGSSSIGKSETALELLQRGHRLVADDAVCVKRISDKLVGTAPANIRHFMELRGIGIIDIRAMYGAGAIRTTKVVDLVVKLESWDENKQYDRLGDEVNYYTLLETELPMYVIPVKPGRNLSVILEVVARNHRLKSMGFNALDELQNRIALSLKPDDAD
ncbi:MAG: HPr(Ser) kinase/phosphatase [Christensenellales bacterium]|jgi:HPr(ser) kinase/phosphatase